MTPITDDFVLALIARAERRRGVLTPANSAAALGQAKKAPAERGGIVALDRMRRRLRPRLMRNGIA
ncbi:MAG: hypothetical protein OIF48_04865 [Silicimonas sp.]|nr:hypothetical protein [Silicimonas sp.]